MKPTMVLLAAGLSTRYGRLKQLEPVGPQGETLMDLAVMDASRAGFQRVVLIVRGEIEKAIRDHITGRWPESMEVVFHHQRLDDLPEVDDRLHGGVLDHRKKPWGTGHALLSAKDLLTEPFVILNADDYYGPTSFQQALSLMGREVEGGLGAPPEFGLVSFALEDTLSPHGGVNRGICWVDPRGWLEGVEEVLGIQKTGSSLSGRTLDGEALILTGREPTSTNFWVFNPAVFPQMEKGFRRFLKEVLPASEGEAEFLIPSEVNRRVTRGEARVKVLQTKDPFFGITHPQDWEWVSEGLKALVQRESDPETG